MRYRGTLFVPGELSGEGLPVTVTVSDRHLELAAGDESLGRYPLWDVTAERVAGDRFDLVLSGDRVVFEADDAIAFSYDAIPHITSSAAPMISDRVRRWWARRAEDESLEVEPSEGQSVSHISRITGSGQPTAALRAVPETEEPELDEHVVAVRSVRDALGVSPGSCPGLTSDGEVCGSTELGARGFCAVHDPDRIAERRLARERLEAAATAAAGYEVGRGLDDIVARLEKAVVEVHDGVLEADRASAMAALVEAMCAVLDRSD